jgi:ribonuclease P protein component
MLPATRRVRRREDFTTAVRHGRRVGSPSLVVHVTNDDTARPARAGFVVGRAVGNAVHRNRLRRQLRHLMATRLERCPMGALVVVRAASPAAGLTSRELAVTLDKLLDRALPAGLVSSC